MEEAQDRLYSKYGRPPSKEALAKATRLSMKTLQFLLLLPKAPISLNQMPRNDQNDQKFERLVCALSFPFDCIFAIFVQLGPSPRYILLLILSKTISTLIIQRRSLVHDPPSISLLSNIDSNLIAIWKLEIKLQLITGVLG